MRRIGINAPNNILREWAKWARTPGYLFNPAHRLDTSRYGALKLPVLAYGFDDDTFATAASIDALLTHFPGCTVSRHQVAPRDLGVPQIGHFGFFKPAMQDTLWRDTVKWLDQSQ
jgi:predicted alpha/beta hydrolase